ncbi:MAG TPA: cytochrome c oxidase accessory protein CcoG [Kiloniellales bacterium]
MTDVVATEDVLSREEQKHQPLYAGRIKVYPKSVRGGIRRTKWAVLIVLLGLYYLAPWLRWDRGPGMPDQALLIDLPNRRAYFFWIEIWPQEIYYLAVIMILAAFGLFLVTSIGGRVWCGFTCPQTVWTDLYMQVERWIEGDRGARIRLDKSPLSAKKVSRKALKHAVWLLIAFATGGAWIMYFKDTPTLIGEFFTGRSSLSVYFFTGLFTTTTYLLAGWAREQVCTYMCPWPRFQAALLDEDSLVVTYRAWRGEPRGQYRKGEGWEGRGDCIDCKQCVAVCPTGIDIRDGLQLECIGCGLCVDACNDVMARIGRPRGLIAFDSERNRQAHQAGRESRPVRLIRLRTIVYVVILAVIATAFLVTIASRADLDVNVLHDRNPLFVMLSDGSIRNGYTVKILNKAHEVRRLDLTLERPAAATLQVVGLGGPESDAARLEAPPDGVATYQVYVRLPPADGAAASQPLVFRLTDPEGGDLVRYESIFRGPGK